jgi:hypothetical protein
MRTGEIIDLSNERRLSAALDFTHAGAELLILNGGSRAEEFTVVVTVKARLRKERRAAYCIDAGTSMNLTLPLLSGEAPGDITIRIVGGHGEMVLYAPPQPRARQALSVRGFATLAAATVLPSGPASNRSPRPPIRRSSRPRSRCNRRPLYRTSCFPHPCVSPSRRSIRSNTSSGA